MIKTEVINAWGYVTFRPDHGWGVITTDPVSIGNAQMVYEGDAEEIS